MADNRDQGEAPETSPTRIPSPEIILESPPAAEQPQPEQSPLQEPHSALYDIDRDEIDLDQSSSEESTGNINQTDLEYMNLLCKIPPHPVLKQFCTYHECSVEVALDDNPEVIRDLEIQASKRPLSFQAFKQYHPVTAQHMKAYYSSIYNLPGSVQKAHNPEDIPLVSKQEPESTTKYPGGRKNVPDPPLEPFSRCTMYSFNCRREINGNVRALHFWI